MEKIFYISNSYEFESIINPLLAQGWKVKMIVAENISASGHTRINQAMVGENTSNFVQPTSNAHKGGFVVVLESKSIMNPVV